jgi:hypothetical protein
MAAHMSGIFIVEYSTQIDGLPLTQALKGQFWLGKDSENKNFGLRGIFHYYNANNEQFTGYRKFFADVHVSTLLSFTVVELTQPSLSF